jgi:hypothetical protein
VQGMVGRAADPADVRRSGCMTLSGKSGTVTFTDGTEHTMGFWTFDPGRDCENTREKDRLAEIIDEEADVRFFDADFHTKTASRIRSEFEVKEKPKAKTRGQIVGGKMFAPHAFCDCVQVFSSEGHPQTHTKNPNGSDNESHARFLSEQVARAIDSELSRQFAEHAKAMKAKDDEIAKLKAEAKRAYRDSSDLFADFMNKRVYPDFAELANRLDQNLKL